MVTLQQMMDGVKLICHSLVSNATKQNVIDLKKKLSSFVVSIDSKLQLFLTILPDDYIISVTFDKNQTVNWNPAENEPLRLDNPQIVQLRANHRGGYVEKTFPEKRGLSVREWILHLFDIFDHSSITSLDFSEGSNRFDTSFIRKMIEGLTVNRTSFHRLSLDNCYNLMMETTKHPKTIILNSDLEPVEYLHKMVIQNTENTIFHALTPQDTIPFRIEDILTNNSENICMYHTVASDKDLNRFLKLWMKGSNPRLKYMELGCGRGARKDPLVIMKGISYRVMERDEQRERPFPMQMESRTIVARGSGAVVIRRMDGVEATVNFVPRPRFMEFAVWD